MQAFQVTTAAQNAVAPARYAFISVKNISDTTVYAKFDGDTTVITTALGHPIEPGVTLLLEDPFNKGIYDNGVDLIHGAAGNKEVRIQSKKRGPL